MRILTSHLSPEINYSLMTPSLWEKESFYSPSDIIIAGSGFLPGLDIFIQVIEFGIEYGCLYRIQAAVTTDHIMIILPRLTMIGYDFHFRSQLIIIGKDRPPISKPTQVFFDG